MEYRFEVLVYGNQLECCGLSIRLSLNVTWAMTTQTKYQAEGLHL